MGNSHSHSIYPANSDGEKAFEPNNDFFEVSFAELILDSQFTSDLLNKDPESVVRPLNIFSDFFISTLISDPIAFGETESPRDVWKTIISPNLSGLPENHSYIHQILTVLFKFFKDRSEILMEREATFRSEYLQNLHQEKNILITSNSQTQSGLSCQYYAHPLYASITEQFLRDRANTIPKEDYSNNVCSLICTLQYLFTELIQKKSRNLGIDISPLDEPLHQIPLNNATFYPCNFSTFPSTTLPNLHHPRHSAISCDETHLYIADRIDEHTIQIHRINLSDENIPISKRISTISLSSDGSSDEIIGFATSNGYGIIVQSRQHLLIQLPECNVISKNSAKIQCPVTSDGYYIYSVSKNIISVFVINQDKDNNISLIRVHHTELKSKNKIKDRLITFCNGPVFTVVSDKPKEDQQFIYQYTNFSVIDGSQITETYNVESQFQVVSITSNPWQRQMIEVIKQGNGYSLIRLPNYSSQPLWLSQETLPFKNQLDKNLVHKSIRNIATFLSYYSIHLNGSSFRSFTQNKTYLMDPTLFFSPCTTFVISSLIDAINYFISAYQNKDYQIPVEEILLSLMRLLNLNLSNFSERVINSKVISVDNLLLREIINCFKRILDPQSNVLFLRSIVYFTLANSFELLFSLKNPQRNDVLNMLTEALNTSSNNVKYYIVKQICKYPEFASSIVLQKMRNVFARLLDKLINDTPLPDWSMLLLNSYMESAFLEMKKIYTNNQGEFTQAEQEVHTRFWSFLGLVLERANFFFGELDYVEENFEQRPFVIFLRKWLALLEPFPQFNRASVEITAIIQPLYTVLAKTLNKFNIPLTIIPEKKGFHEFSMIFYETFSILVNSIGALLDGGCEIKDIHQYMWLLKSTLRHNLKKENVEEWFDDFQKKRQTIVSEGPRIIEKRGVSYNIFRDDRPTDSAQLQNFINKFLVQNPSATIMNFMNYLHTQCQKNRKARQQKSTPESEQVEPVVFACLIKQLGLTNKLYLESIEFLKNRECDAAIFGNVINALHKIRNQVIFSKRKTQEYNQNARRGLIQQPPTLLQQNDKFLEEIMKKAVFLLNVNPCLRFEANEYTKLSDNMLNNLTAFITSDKTIDVYFNVVQSIRKSFQHISTGFAIANTILEESIQYPKFMDCSYYMIEHLAQNTSILKFLDSNNEVTKKDSFQPYPAITTFLCSLCEFVAKSEDKTTLSSSIVFFMSICMSISITDDILNTIGELIDELIKIGNNHPNLTHYVKSYLVFVASALMIMCKENKSIKTNPKYTQLLTKLMPDSISESEFPIAKICYLAGIQSNHSMKDLFDKLSSCSPIYYQTLISYLADLVHDCSDVKQKIDILYDILNAISLTVAGCQSPIMSNYEYEVKIDNLQQVVKSAPLLLSGCSELIQLCRHLLKDEDNIMNKIIEVVLSDNCDDIVFSQFHHNRNELQYGIFAILSNIIEVIHCNSFVKNRQSNETYFVNQIDKENGAIWVYKIPLESKSKTIGIRINKDMIPVSLLPFNINLYQNYELLIPIFLKSLKHELPPALSIFVYASLREYCINSTFLVTFQKQLNEISFDSISYTNSIPQFVELIKHHLSQQSFGFINQTNNEFLTKNFFNEFCFYNALDPKMPNVKSRFKLDSHFALLVSSLMPLNNDCKLSLTIYASDFDVGVVCPSLHSNTDYLYVSAREESSFSYKIEIIYNKLMGVSIVVKEQDNAVKHELHDTAKMIDSPFCFIINFMSNGNVKFTFSSSNHSTDIEDNCLINSLNELNARSESAIANTYMSIPCSLLKSLPKSLDTPPKDLKELYSMKFYDLQRDINIKQIKEQYQRSPSREITSSVFYPKESDEIYNSDNSVVLVDKWNTGFPLRFSKSNPIVFSRFRFLNPYEIDVLPPHITNYYAKQLSLECHSEICNFIFIQFIQNAPQISLDYTYNLFKPNLVKNLVNLILILEPILLRNHETRLLQLNLAEPIFEHQPPIEKHIIKQNNHKLDEAHNTAEDNPEVSNPDSNSTANLAVSNILALNSTNTDDSNSHHSNHSDDSDALLTSLLNDSDSHHSNDSDDSDSHHSNDSHSHHSDDSDHNHDSSSSSSSSNSGLLGVLRRLLDLHHNDNHNSSHNSSDSNSNSSSDSDSNSNSSSDSDSNSNSSSDSDSNSNSNSRSSDSNSSRSSDSNSENESNTHNNSESESNNSNSSLLELSSSSDEYRDFNDPRFKPEKNENKDLEVEKASIDSIIDFKYNLFESNAQLNLIDLEQYLSALRKIINFVEQQNSQNQFADDWFNFLENQFKTGFSHSCFPSSQSGFDSYFVNMNKELSPFTISRKDVIAWIVCCVGFSTREEKQLVKRADQKKAIKSSIYCKVNNVKMTKSLMTVKGSTVILTFKRKEKTLVLIPVTPNSNDSLVGSFLGLALSFKYFTNYISERKTSLKNIQKYKIGLYSHFFNGIISRSPFFYAYLKDIFQYLQEKLKTLPSDLTPEFISSINTLALYAGDIPEIKLFILEQQQNWNERILLPLIHFFPDFMTEADRQELKSIDPSTIQFELPSKTIPYRIDKEDNLNPIIQAIKRLMPHYPTLQGFPYYILLNEWKEYIITCLPYTAKSVNETTIEVKFTLFTPKYAVLNVYSADFQSGTDHKFSISTDKQMTQATTISKDTAFDVPSDILYIQSNYELDLFKFLITTPLKNHQPYHDEVINSINPNEFILNNRQLFTEDMKLFTTKFSYLDDQQILTYIPDKVYMCDKLDLGELESNLDKFIPSEIVKRIPYYLVLLRAKILCVLNWLIHISPALFDTDIELKALIPSISMNYKWKIFKQKIHEKSNTTKKEFKINRLIATDFKTNDKTKETVNSTLISQMAKIYRDASEFRCELDQPFKVRFEGEEGFDLGGLARELMTECADELTMKKCGLVVPVPNANYETGNYHDCVIPISSPEITNREEQYKFVGALIAMAIRTDLSQSFMFPPFVWKFLLNGELSVDGIFEIDSIYQRTITLLQDAMKSDMSNEKFVSEFPFTFTIIDYLGQTKDLIRQGSTIQVDKTNCNQYIQLSNQFRINELKQNLEWIRSGLWDNLDISPPSILDWNTLQYSACGKEEITIETLKSVTKFIDISKDQIEIFWRVIKAFSQQERSDLLKYATGRSRLPAKLVDDSYLIVDEMDGVDIIPGSSTCFHKLHMPKYTSYQKALEFFNLALVYANSVFDKD